MDIKMIATLIQKHYNECNAFIVVTGLDTICHVGTSLSFMLEHLSKLVHRALFRSYVLGVTCPSAE